MIPLNSKLLSTSINTLTSFQLDVNTFKIYPKTNFSTSSPSKLSNSALLPLADDCSFAFDTDVDSGCKNFSQSLTPILLKVSTSRLKTWFTHCLKWSEQLLLLGLRSLTLSFTRDPT
ncbi:hypothetical protein SDJN03_14308, partial [Cucurbita argyrosperma subsp. sororia]